MAEITAIDIPDTVRRIGFFGDVHGVYMNVIRVLEMHPDVGRWFSVGDVVDMDVAVHSNQPALRILKKMGVASVRGNHEQYIMDHRLREYDDETRDQLNAMPSQIVVRFGERRLSIFHYLPGDETGTRVRNRRIEPLDPATRPVYLRAFRSVGPGFYVVGHVQGPYDIADAGVRILNPGSLGGKGDQPASFAVMDRDGSVTITKLQQE